MGIFGGLLGDSVEDPRSMAVMRLAEALQGQRGRGLGGLLGGLTQGSQAYMLTMAQSRKEAEEQKRRALQEQMFMQQLEDAKQKRAESARARAQQQTDSGLLSRGLNMGPQMMGPQSPGEVGPPLPVQRPPGVDPQWFLNQGGSAQGLQQALSLQQAMARPERKITASRPGDVGRDDLGIEVWRNPEAPVKPDNVPQGFKRGADGGLTVDPNWLNVQLQLKAAGRAPPDSADSTLDIADGAITNAAARYNIDGTLPPMGMGKHGVAGRAKILNRASELAAAAGASPDEQRVAHITNKANAAALAKLTAQEQATGNFEKTAVKNLGIALEQSEKVGRSGIPVLNRWLMAGRKEILGDPEVQAFHVANETFVNEYAKIMSGSMGNTVVSDSLRKEVHSMLATKTTKEQYRAATDIMRREMDNRMSSFKDQRKELTGDIRPAQGTKQLTFANEAAATAAAAAGTLRKGDKITINGVSGTWQ